MKALQALTRCLLLKDFNLDVNLPSDKLIPTLPLRLNYILWLEDILKVAGCVGNVTGIDIGKNNNTYSTVTCHLECNFSGCGASCIYPLLAARRNSWYMYALESNTDSAEHARRNVAHNKLDTFVTVMHQPNESVIFEGLCALNSFITADFCMCNPPFFDSQDEICATSRINRTGHRPQPKNSITGASDELMATGGECQFVQQIIRESCRLRERIRVYTTMLGHKSSVQRILHMLSTADITNIATSEFCQGQTTRWGVSWSFLPSILLKTVPTFSTRLPKKKSFIFNVPAATDGIVDVFDVQTKLERLFANIGLKMEIISHSSSVVKGRVSAMSNTWTKQRRKRRENERLAVPQFENRINEEFESLYKSDGENGPSAKLRRIDITSTDSMPAIPVLVIDITICKHLTKGVAINLEYLNGPANHDGVYQVLQFIQNHWK